MDAREFELFARAFHRAVLLFEKRVSQGDEMELAHSYFKLLQRFPLESVLDAWKTWCASERSFPRAAELLRALAPPTAAAAPLSAGARAPLMRESELEEYALAAAQGFQRPPCCCGACVAANIDHEPLRFVPTLAGDTEARAWNPRTQRLDVLGHWAHGAELARWYAARAAFFRHREASPFARVLSFVGREPGEDDA